MPKTYDIEQFKLIALKQHGAFENNTPSIDYFRDRLAVFIQKGILYIFMFFYLMQLQ